MSFIFISADLRRNNTWMLNFLINKTWEWYIRYQKDTWAKWELITKLHEMMDKAFFLKISNLIDRTSKVFPPGWCYLSSESPVLVTWECEWWSSDIVRFPNPLASWQLGMVVHGSWGTWLQWHDPGVTLRQRQPGHVDVHRPEQGKSLQLGWNPRAMLLCNRGTEQARGVG